MSRITQKSVEEVRQRARLDDIVGEYVQLRSAGADSLKGLCPFHDEKTPSFHVRPSAGYFHCFGCGEGGDAIAFVQKIEHVSFVEAIEHLARKFGVTVEKEETGGRREPGGVKKSRLIDAHRVAVEFYEQHLRSNDGALAMKILHDRHFDDAAIADYRLGYSPQSWDSLYSHLRKHGFYDEEILEAGLATRGRRGIYDRFRGRLMWPIMSITGEPIGFGARKIHDDDEGPKYLNTPETPIYHKSQVLYGLDKAKKSIARERRVVVVEGYTDVMAMHLAGVPYAVATCGTAFGADHIRIVRRLLGDSHNPAAGVMLSSGQTYGGEVIFTFDGDAAGQKAALKAFAEDQSFATQTFIAVAPEGKDPCEVRMAYGDEGVRAIVEGRLPLFEFAIRSTLATVSLSTAEGRTSGLRAAAPMVASIRDRVLRSEYTRQLASWLGMDEQTVREAVQEAKKRGLPRFAAPSEPNAPSEPTPPAQTSLTPLAQLKDPVERLEREVLGAYLQFPWHTQDSVLNALDSRTFLFPLHQRVYEAILAAGGTSLYTQRFNELRAASGDGGANEESLRRQAAQYFLTTILESTDSLLRPAMTQIAVEPLPERREEHTERYVRTLTASLVRQGIVRQIAELRSVLQRTDSTDPQYNSRFEYLMELEKKKREWEAQLS
ncbi:MAG: DNA primase [Actinomycetaceae bacterium]|nr:DNA primase [Actinomycetaceae bacterium]